MKRDPVKLARLCILIADKVGYRCEICHQNPDWRGLSGAHIIRRSKGRKSAPNVAWNILIACGICHDHDKYPLRGYAITEEQALEIARLRNKKHGISPVCDDG